MVLPRVKRALCLSVGIFLLATGCVLIPVFKHIIHQTVAKDVPLVKGSLTYDDWVVPPIPVYYQLWVFDLVNPLEVIAGAKPYVVQRGPYTYREHRKKYNITFEPNGTITYRQLHWYTFDRSKSCGPDSDKFTTANVPLMTVGNMVRFEYPWVQELVDLVLKATKDSDLFQQYSVRDIAWGYEDPLLKAAKDIVGRYNISIDDKIGLFYGTNDTDDGLYNIHSGGDDISKLAIINKWNGLTRLPYWSTDRARMINGTDGTFFPPFVDKSWTMYVFQTDICRSLYLYYKEMKTLRGVDLYSFVLPDRVFEALSENDGFCTPNADNCLPAGLLNVSNCKEEFAPIVGSQPHFYAADPSVQQAVEGLNPIPGEHQTNIDVEPHTGIVMNIDKRLQVNLFIHNISHISATKNFNRLVYPILWLNESATLDGKLANMFKTKVDIPIKITQAVQYGLIILGTLIALCVVTFMVKECNDRNRKIPYKRMAGKTNNDKPESRTEIVNENRDRVHAPEQDS
ncbi:lysosome membrane protein 2-like [Ylistrum balloti]|uniref:lysosome membrane protein 2-like n=1 Tax=Ylistrum balloti TaxID=509963 RepID=UPI002905D2DA|nr:lysosome membrane protein 2-like [Ylistrum balloti]